MTSVRFRLFVAGSSARSEAAITDLRQLMESDIDGEAEVEVIDVLERPEIAESNHILVTPTLDKILPMPTRRIIGDLSDSQAVLKALGLLPRRGADRPEQ